MCDSSRLISPEEKRAAPGLGSSCENERGWRGAWPCRAGSPPCVPGPRAVILERADGDRLVRSLAPFTGAIQAMRGCGNGLSPLTASDLMEGTSRSVWASASCVWALDRDGGSSWEDETRLRAHEGLQTGGLGVPELPGKRWVFFLIQPLTAL